MAFQQSIPVKLEPDEKVILDLRRHGMILFGRLLPPIVILLTPIVLVLWALLAGSANPEQADATIRFARIALVILVLPLAIWAAIAVYDWGNDSFHVTNKRVIRYDQTFIASQTLMVAGLQQIQNVAVTIPNPIASFFNYGTVIIETAAQAGKIEFDNIGNPRRVQRLIFELRGVPMPPQEPLPLPRSVGDLLLELFPFAPRSLPDGGIVYHKHWYILFQAALLPMLLLIAASSAAWYIRSWLPLLLLIGIVPLLLYQYANWVNDIYILTNNRIIDIVRIPMIKEDRREALLEQIQNVSLNVPNLQGRLLDMGDVFVETAGKGENFLFKSVNHPRAIAEEISKRLDQVRSGRRQAEEESRRRQIEELVTDILQTQYGVPASSGSAPPPPNP